MLRAIPLLSALVLLLSSPSQAAFVSATPASLPAATSENASTAFLNDGSESRIGLLCHNDPINKSDPTGLDPVGRLIGEIVGGVTFGIIGGNVGMIVLGGTGVIAGFPEGGPVGSAVVGGTGAVVGGIGGAAIGTLGGIKLGGDVGDAIGDKVRNILESRGRDQGERRRQHENPNRDKPQRRDHQTGKKLPDKPPEKPKQPEPEVIPKGKKLPGD